jgi:hypothetical protein
MNSCLYTLIITGLTFLLSGTADLYAQTRLGLQVSQEELNIWRERAENGPFKSRGDVCTNSIGDWDRVVSYKDNFVKRGYLEFWEDSGTVPLSGYISNSDIKWKSKDVRDAAFYALIKEDHAVKDMVKEWLLTQSDKVNFEDRTRWPLGTFNNEHLFGVCGSIMRLIYTMEYIRSMSSFSITRLLLTMRVKTAMTSFPWG